MKVRFKNYIYFDKSSDDKNEYNATSGDFSQFAYDAEKYQKLIDNQQYEEAADYMDKFMFYGDDDSAKRNKELKTNIASLRRDGRKTTAMWSKIQDPNDNAAVTFYDAFNSNSLDRIDKTPELQERIDAFQKAKRAIGGEKSNELTVTFRPGKQKFLGFDILKIDNPHTIENFYDNTGLNLETLKRYGVNVSKLKDGSTTLTFDKSNKLADKILYNVPTAENTTLVSRIFHPDTYYPTIKGNKEEYNVANKDMKYLAAYAEGSKHTSFSEFSKVGEYQRLINDCKKIKDKYVEDFSNTTKEYQAISIPYVTDAIKSVKEAYERGEYKTEGEFNTHLKMADKLYTTIKTLDYANYDIYSNYYNAKENNGIFSLSKVSLEDRPEICKLLSEAEEKDMEFTGKVVNGKIGICVTLNRRKKEDLKNGEKLDNELYSNRLEFWIPGLEQENIQKQIDADTKTRANIEYNDMLDYRYDYKLNDGSSIELNSDGDFVKKSKRIGVSDKVLTKDEVIKEINRDLILRDASNELLFTSMNYKGNLIDENLYSEMAKSIAVQAANELYPNSINKLGDSPYYNIKGLSNFTLDDILNHRYDPLEVQYEVNDILDEIYNMYNNLMLEMINYK